MLKKVVLGMLLVGLVGILVTGAVIRTVDKTGQVVKASGLEGQGYAKDLDHGGEEGDCDGTESEGNAGREGTGTGRGNGGGQGGQGLGSGSGQGAEAGQGQRLAPSAEAATGAWSSLEGEVAVSPVDGQDMVVVTADGQEIHVGTGPGYMEAQGFTLQTGDRVQVQGYWEDDDLKAASVTRLRDGATITLRDQDGRPAWSGAGKRAAERELAAPREKTGQGQGARGNQGSLNPGTEQAVPGQWLVAQGTVSGVENDALIVLTTDGQEISVTGRAWRFALENGFRIGPGDPVRIAGFFEGEAFEVGQLENETSGQVVQIREISGRPLWAGQGRRGSQ